MRRLLAVLLFVTLLSGCRANAAGSWPGDVHHLVISARIEDSGLRYLENPDDLAAVLGYFRSLQTAKPQLSVAGQPRKITLLFSDGHKKELFLIDDRYYRVGSGPWLAIVRLPEMPFQQLMDSITAPYEP